MVQYRMAPALADYPHHLLHPEDLNLFFTTGLIPNTKTKNSIELGHGREHKIEQMHDAEETLVKLNTKPPQLLSQ